MKHKTSELTGALLDEAVFKAEGLGYTRSTIIKITDFGTGRGGAMVSNNVPAYSTDWNAGGPIIEREGISLEAPNEHDYGSDQWTAEFEHPARSDGVQRSYGIGETPLIAAMRAYVASRLGDEVEL